MLLPFVLHNPTKEMRSGVSLLTRMSLTEDTWPFYRYWLLTSGLLWPVSCLLFFSFVWILNSTSYCNISSRLLQFKLWSILDILECLNDGPKVKDVGEIRATNTNVRITLRHGHENDCLSPATSEEDMKGKLHRGGGARQRTNGQEFFCITWLWLTNEQNALSNWFLLLLLLR